MKTQTEVKFSREWAMPSANTFSIPPIQSLLLRLCSGGVVVDPFARNATFGSITNDLNPNTCARYHMKAEDFSAMLVEKGVVADVVLFDPPYSPRQISECYQSVGMKAGMEDTQNGRLYRVVKDGLSKIVRPGGIAISFGWNSAGFGLKRGFVQEEILLVPHGGGHNDTIVVVERKLEPDETLWSSLIEEPTCN